ncbi:YfzA family protein [Lederbergia ruris]|uniref:YfzA family protein n=1 Tax=Lederbergia ruris TaxID=217495 RepID=UPI0039A0FCB0
MSEETEASRGKILKDRLIGLGIFIFAQIIFILLDGTGWEPNVRDTDIINRILNAKLFTEYFHFYSYPFFNFVTFVFLIAILLSLLADVLSIIFKRK